MKASWAVTRADLAAGLAPVLSSQPSHGAADEFARGEGVEPSRRNNSLGFFACTS